MPFGWVGFDALAAWKDAFEFKKASPMPFGWVGFDALTAQRAESM